MTKVVAPATGAVHCSSTVIQRRQSTCERERERGRPNEQTRSVRRGLCLVPSPEEEGTKEGPVCRCLGGNEESFDHFRLGRGGVGEAGHAPS